jgi:hypothetical protein
VTRVCKGGSDIGLLDEEVIEGQEHWKRKEILTKDSVIVGKRLRVTNNSSEGRAVDWISRTRQERCGQNSKERFKLCQNEISAQGTAAI